MPPSRCVHIPDLDARMVFLWEHASLDWFYANDVRLPRADLDELVRAGKLLSSRTCRTICYRLFKAR